MAFGRKQLLRPGCYYLLDREEPEVAERFMQAAQKSIAELLCMPRKGAPKRLSSEALLSWGWRAIFFSGLFVTIGAMGIRAKIAESPVFVELKEQQGGEPNEKT